MKLRDLVRCGICTALMAVSAWLSVPVGEISFTFQSFALFLTLYLLGGGKGTAAFGAYLLLGAVGVPVFSGFQGGFGVLLGPTGGYLWGFLLGCFCFWLPEKRLPRWVLLVGCQLLCYLCGSLWYGLVYTGGGLWAVVLKCVVPYLLPDGLKLMLALAVSKRLKNIVSYTP